MIRFDWWLITGIERFLLHSFDAASTVRQYISAFGFPASSSLYEEVLLLKTGINSYDIRAVTKMIK
ncbi:hypothetical protein CW304_23795 [Bacillus sp. UFRGS-B20]|nr:hypothetical protein CW304_23795 [Bacillus sp. UFRGS-B20]